MLDEILTFYKRFLSSNNSTQNIKNMDNDFLHSKNYDRGNITGTLPVTNQKMGENFCNAPFAALEVTPQGDCRVCCQMPQQSVLRPDGTNYRVNQDGISVIWQSQWMKDFRERFINNERPSECSMCWDDEKAGIVSLRKQLSGMYIHDVHNPKLKNLTLKLSNKCNCACRICSFWLSSLWETEIKKSGRMLDRDVWFIEENSKDKISSEFWNDWQENLKTLDSLLIYGGEPLINDEVLMILRYLVENGLSKKMSLYLNTNGTIMNPDVIGLLYEFKETGLYFSIDDVFDRYNYERWPAKYENIKKDLLELHDTYNRSNVNICLYTSISIFNIFYLVEFNSL